MSSSSMLKHHINQKLQTVRRNHRVAIRFGKEKNIYTSYDKRIEKFFTELAKTIESDAISCVYDFPEEAMYLSLCEDQGEPVDVTLKSGFPLDTKISVRNLLRGDDSLGEGTNKKH